MYTQNICFAPDGAMSSHTETPIDTDTFGLRSNQGPRDGFDDARFILAFIEVGLRNTFNDDMSKDARNGLMLMLEFCNSELEDIAPHVPLSVESGE